MGTNGGKVIEDNIYSGIALASKITHVNSRVNGVQRPIEGIDLMDVPQVECKMYNVESGVNNGETIDSEICT